MKKLVVFLSLFIIASVVSKSTEASLSAYFQGRFDAAGSVAAKNDILRYIRLTFLNFDGARSIAAERGSARLDTEVYTSEELEQLCGCCEAKFNELNALIPADERRFPAWSHDDGGELGEHID